MTEVMKLQRVDSEGRFARFELISWWDQPRLASARVLVVGAGALGNELVKNLALVADKKIQFRIEVFNAFNRANFAVPNRAVFAGAAQNDPILPTAGQITRTTNTSRQLQLSAKIVF